MFPSSWKGLIGFMILLSYFTSSLMYDESLITYQIDIADYLLPEGVSTSDAFGFWGYYKIVADILSFILNAVGTGVLIVLGFIGIFDYLPIEFMVLYYIFVFGLIAQSVKLVWSGEGGNK